MSTQRSYITTSIPYVNGDPHLGHVLEFVQADVLARHWRALGKEVRFLTGTDDNALKNVQAASLAGVPVADYVNEKAERFEALRGPLQLSYDDFIRTSQDPRHSPAVERLWRACYERGDIYERDYDGLYCAGCEAFVYSAELVDGKCAEHRVEPERRHERNWFFRLSRHGEALRELIERRTLLIEPEHRRNEVLAFIGQGLDDISISRDKGRSHGWGLPVPDDSTQVVWVWFDALVNYISSLGYGTDSDDYSKWWCDSTERLHVIGKGIIRFHAVFWPAFLLSAGEPLPTAIFVHDYLTVNGEKIGKSLGNVVDPVDVVSRFGPDALRWWLLRDIPRVGDADYRDERIGARANELADGLGNLVGRVLTLVNRYRPDGIRPVHGDEHGKLGQLVNELPQAVSTGIEALDFRCAADAIWDVVDEANRYIEQTQPWKLAKDAVEADPASHSTKLDEVLATALNAIRAIAAEASPFLPEGSRRVAEAVQSRIPPEEVLFPKVLHNIEDT